MAKHGFDTVRLLRVLRNCGKVRASLTRCDGQGRGGACLGGLVRGAKDGLGCPVCCKHCAAGGAGCCIWPLTQGQLQPLKLRALMHTQGHAVRQGMRMARGEFCLFMDADGATRFQDLEGLEAALAKWVARWRSCLLRRCSPACHFAAACVHRRLRAPPPACTAATRVLVVGTRRQAGAG